MVVSGKECGIHVTHTDPCLSDEATEARRYALLELFARQSTRKAYLDGVVELLRRWTGCEAVGVRVLDKEGNIPYGSYSGLSDEFWESENFLSVTRDTCACLRVVTGNPDPQDAPCMTPFGSFHLNRSDAYFSSLDEAEKARFRGRCIATGYETIAVIPIRSGDTVIGAIHLADKRQDFLPTETLESIETIQVLIGQAVQRLDCEEQLQRSEEKYRSIVENARDGVFRISLDGQWLSANRALFRMLGFASEEEMLKSSCSPSDGSKGDLVRLAGLLQGAVEGMTVRLSCMDGRDIWASIDCWTAKDEEGNPKYREGIVRDVTENRRWTEDRERFEGQLRRSEKLESLAVLARGVAHDFNNILAAINGFAELAFDKAPEGSRERRAIQQISKASLRGKELVSRILMFSKEAEQELKVLELAAVVRESLKLLKASIPPKINVVLRSVNRSKVFGDPVQLRQVITNLVTNAAYSMREKGGRLEISVEDVVFSSSSNLPHPDIVPGPYAKLSVRDAGCGISKQSLEFIFDPFFTTKEPGKGTGLGLSIVHGIVKTHKGAVTVESTEGEGSLFTVYLPRHLSKAISRFSGV